MTSPLIAEYVTGLHQSLPADIADEAATGLIDTYQDHLDSGASDQVAAHAALAEFGDLTMVVGEFTRQAPGRHAARLLLATGPVVGAGWAAALVLSRAWTWPVPATARLSIRAAAQHTPTAGPVASSSRAARRPGDCRVNSPTTVARSPNSASAARAASASPAPVAR